MGNLGEALAFLTFSLGRFGRFGRESRSTPLTFPNFFPSAACRDMKPGATDFLPETFESFVGMLLSLKTDGSFLKLGIKSRFFKAVSVEGAMGLSIVTFLTSESWELVRSRLGQKGDFPYIA